MPYDGYIVLGALGGSIWLTSLIIKGVGARNRHRRELRTRRLDVLAEALREPGLDAATRADILRAIASDQTDVWGWLWQRLQKPALWRVLWFGGGWMVMLICGAAIALDACGWSLMSKWERPGVAIAAAIGFGMVTLPLALRELRRREQLATRDP